MSAGKSSLVFQQIIIRRTPGILSPFTIDGLTGGINIIYGPNASGKSTTARALQMLLWNNQPEWSRASLAGRISLDGSEWLVDIDAGVVDVRRDGVNGVRLPVETLNERDRYVLTLHDLLQTDNADFASVILRESAGGYDIDAASRHLGYSIVSGRINNLTRDQRRAQQALRLASTAQQDLAREQQTLDQLKARREAARTAVAGSGLLERALTAKRATRELEFARETLAALPQNISLLSGDELDRLREIDKRRAEYELRTKQTEAEIQQAEREIERANLNGRKLPPGYLPGLRTQAQQLQDYAADLRRATAELASQTTQRDHAAGRLGRRMDDERIREFEASGLRQLEDIARRLEQARSEYEAADALRSWLGETAPLQDIDRLRQGISQLNRWLRTAESPEAASGSANALIPAIAAAALIFILSLAAAVIGHPIFLGAIPLAAIPIVLALVLKPGASTDRSTFVREDYQRLGLEQPQVWKPDAVEALIDQFNQELQRQQLDQERSQRWAGLEQRWQQAVTAFREVQEQWTGMLEWMGSDPIEPALLEPIVQNLERWQAADSRVAVARTLVERQQRDHDRLLHEINQSLTATGYSEAADHGTVLGYINELDGRLQLVNSAVATKEHARNMLESTIQPEQQRLVREHQSIFASLGLESADERQLAAWLDQRDDFQTARESVTQAELAHRHAMVELEGNEDLLDQSELELETDLESSRARAEEAEQLNRSIIEIETRIDEAKKDRNLEQAIVDERIAGDALRDDREDAYRLAAGWTLANFVRQKTRDRDRPQVFHRARELFVRMTQGRYRLQFSDNPSPAFRAIDTTTNREHGLDELSSATRVQLLMAVRMAFVEEMEHGPKLPLILDETLGNADEHRAEAIIRAVCEICRQGRQVFYFTAQLDEVGKWRRLLQEYDELPYRVVSLVETRQLAEYERSVLENLEPSRPTVPPPDGTNRLRYRHVLHVPEINLDLSADAVHLWYLVDDPDHLHHLLTLGISTWGQLRTLIEFGGDDLVSPDAFSSALARAGVVDAALKARRIGRGRRVTRATVLDSGAFTPAFIERVIRQVDQANSDAELLLQRLEDGKVRRMRTDYIDAFRNYLVDEGYLDDAEPLSQGAIRARVVGEAARDIAVGAITADDIAMLLDCLPPIQPAPDEPDTA